MASTQNLTDKKYGDSFQKFYIAEKLRGKGNGHEPDPLIKNESVCLPMKYKVNRGGRMAHM